VEKRIKVVELNVGGMEMEKAFPEVDSKRPSLGSICTFNPPVEV